MSRYGSLVTLGCFRWSRPLIIYFRNQDCPIITALISLSLKIFGSVMLFYKVLAFSWQLILDLFFLIRRWSLIFIDLLYILCAPVIYVSLSLTKFGIPFTHGLVFQYSTLWLIIIFIIVVKLEGRGLKKNICRCCGV